jgi:predicted metal-dependent hydrolase
MTPPYQLIRSHKRKTLGIQIRDGRVQVRAPASVGRDEIERVLRRRREWIDRHLHRQREQIERHRVQIGQGGRVLLEGRWLALAWQRAGRSEVRQLPGRLQVSLSTRVRREEDEAVRALVQQWFRAQAQVHLIRRCGELAEGSGLIPAGIHIGNWRARWGQCSSKGEIGLNWRLLQLEPTLQDYVIWHELCHLRQMNHGPRFHALLARHCPAHLRLRAELARYGGCLNW